MRLVLAFAVVLAVGCGRDVQVSRQMEACIKHCESNRMTVHWYCNVMNGGVIDGNAQCSCSCDNKAN